MSDAVVPALDRDSQASGLALLATEVNASTKQKELVSAMSLTPKRTAVVSAVSLLQSVRGGPRARVNRQQHELTAGLPPARFVLIPSCSLLYTRQPHKLCNGLPVTPTSSLTSSRGYSVRSSLVVCPPRGLDRQLIPSHPPGDQPDLQISICSDASSDEDPIEASLTDSGIEVSQLSEPAGDSPLAGRQALTALDSSSA